MSSSDGARSGILLSGGVGGLGTNGASVGVGAAWADTADPRDLQGKGGAATAAFAPGGIGIEATENFTRSGGQFVTMTQVSAIIGVGNVYGKPVTQGGIGAYGTDSVYIELDWARSLAQWLLDTGIASVRSD